MGGRMANLKYVVLGIGLMSAAINATAVETTQLTDDESYMIGQMIGNYLQKNHYHLLPLPDKDKLYEGMQDMLEIKRPKIGRVSARPVYKSIQERVKTAKAAERDELARFAQNPKAYLEHNKKRKGVVTLPSGLQYEVLQYGEGETPTLENAVMLRFSGKVLGGDEFINSTRDRQYAKRPIEMSKLTLPAWQEALLHMQLGDRWRLVIPPELGFGEKGNKKFEVPPNSVLISEVELVHVLTRNADDNDEKSKQDTAK